MRNESEKRGEKNFLKIFEFWNSKEGSFALKSTKQELFIQPHISPFSSPMISRKRKVIKKKIIFIQLFLFKKKTKK